MHTLLHDIRFSFRTLLKRPSFALIAMLVLGLGIGATTAIFSIVDAVLLRPLPYRNAERLVAVREVGVKGNQMALSEPNFHDLLAQSRSFEELSIAGGSFPLVVTGAREAGQARVSWATASFFRAMGVAPVAGRSFLAEEEKWGGPVAAVVSYRYWEQMLGARTDFSSVKLNVDGVSCNVVGIMPPSFDYPSKTDIWITRNTEPPGTSRTAHNCFVIGLLRPETTIERAGADVSLIANQLRQTHGTRTDAAGFALIPLQNYLARNVRQGLWLLLGAVGLLLVVACANFSNLLLGQLVARRHEFTLRVALGASRARLTRQVLVENLMLTLPGAVLGILLAGYGVSLVLLLDNGTFPRVNAIGIDIRVLAFACTLAILIAIVLSFLPGVRARRDLTTGLQSGARQTAGRRGKRLRSSLVVGQIGLTLILLTGAGLLVRSFLKAMEVKPGFDSGGAIAMMLSLPTTISVEEDEQLRQFYAQLLERVGRLPGVTAVGGINVLPLNGGPNGQFLIDDDETKPGNADYRVASAGYFSAMKIPLLRGRVFDRSDTVSGRHVAVISQSLAQRYWANEDPIGKHIQFGNMDTDKRLMQIVGVVGDVRRTLEREPQPTVYGYSLQRPQWWQVVDLSIVVRSESDPQSLIPLLRTTVQSLRPDVPTSFETLEEVFSQALDARRFSLTLFGVFGGVALVITIIGLYGMLTFSVTERTREMGIRMALGAQRGSVLRLVIRQGLQLAAIGVLIGLAGAWALTRLMSNLLFGVTPTDWFTMGAVVFVVALVALAACYLPARRATRIDPLVALREE
jgi:putative ABC transport system permease protein